MALGGRWSGWPKRGPWSRLKPSLPGVDGNPVGTAPASEFKWGAHALATHVAEALKSSIFESVAAAAVATAAAVPALVIAPPQAYASPNPSFIGRPLSGATPQPLALLRAAPQLADLALQALVVEPTVGPQGPTVRPLAGGPLQADLTLQAVLSEPTPARQGAVPPQTLGAPQPVDLTLQASLAEPLITRQGAVPPQTLGAPQADQSQVQPLLTPPQPAAAIVPNPIARFFSQPPQAEERPARVVWQSQRAGASPAVPPLTLGAPQADPGQAAAIVSRTPVAPAVAPNPLAAFFSVPPQFEERSTRIAWQPQRAGARPTAPPTVLVFEQAYDYQQKALVVQPSRRAEALPIRQLGAAPQQAWLQAPSILVPASVTPRPSQPIRSLYGAPQLAWLQAPSQLYAPPQAFFVWQAPHIMLDRGERARLVEQTESSRALDRGERAAVVDPGEGSRIIDEGQGSRGAR